MMRLNILCLALSLVACSQAEQEPTEQADQVAPADSSANLSQVAFDGGPNVGVFKAISKEGVVLTQTASADGKIVSVDGDGNSVNGTYTMGDGRFCITNEGEDGPSCFTYSDLKDDGSWTATNVDDPTDSWTVSRVPAE